MRNVICLIYDKVAQQYSAPMSFLNVDCAIRYFKSLKTSNKVYNDLVLYYVADFEPQNGIITLIDSKVLVSAEDEVIENE